MQMGQPIATDLTTKTHSQTYKYTDVYTGMCMCIFVYRHLSKVTVGACLAEI